MCGASAARSISYLPISAPDRSKTGRLAIYQIQFVDRIRRSKRVGLADDQIAAVGARHGAADQQQIVLGVDADQLQIPAGRAGIAVAAGHPLPLEDAAGGSV